ncbi:MAG: hypothetical protein ACTSRA_13670 [Promethearchaeota archaeon]
MKNSANSPTILVMRGSPVGILREFMYYFTNVKYKRKQRLLFSRNQHEMRLFKFFGVISTFQFTSFTIYPYKTL